MFSCSQRRVSAGQSSDTPVMKDHQVAADPRSSTSNQHDDRRSRMQVGRMARREHMPPPRRTGGGRPQNRVFWAPTPPQSGQLERARIRRSARIAADYSRLFVTIPLAAHGPRRAGATDGRRWPLPTLQRSLLAIPDRVGDRVGDRTPTAHFPSISLTLHWVTSRSLSAGRTRMLLCSLRQHV
jgi:hypothetical protein